MLEAHSLSFGYAHHTAQENLLYQGFSMSVGRSERVALKAPSGFGKTTLCRLLAGFETPWSGSVLVGGQPLPKKGVCPVQMIGQHPESVIDPRMRMIDVLLEAGELDQHLIEGLGIENSWMRRFSHELSGGQLQRFCIARALTARPRFVIADEISTMLDSVTQASVWKFLLEEAEKKQFGIIFVSHSPALTDRIATRVIKLDALQNCVLE